MAAAPAKDIAVSEAATLTDSGATWTFLDVRTVEEFSAGHAPGAVNIPVATKGAAGMVPNDGFLQLVRAEFPDKDAWLVVGCKSGMRSRKACNMMTEDGYQNLVNVAGGFDAWTAAQLPVEK